jgi:DNA-3-methyladenine glycosylase II
MWFDIPEELPDWMPALRHLAKVDAAMKGVIARVGPCTLAPRGDPFVSLCQAIFTQQVSTAVATVLFGRFRKLFRANRPTPRGVTRLSEEQMRSAGLSRQKQAYLRDLAERFDRGEIPVKRFPEMSDEEIVQALLPIKGVGRWTAEMFLIFVLNRPDVFPVDDLGVRKNVQALYGLNEMPRADEVIPFGEKWRPWRTVATWYLWRWAALDDAAAKETTKARKLSSRVIAQSSRSK